MNGAPSRWIARNPPRTVSTVYRGPPCCCSSSNHASVRQWVWTSMTVLMLVSCGLRSSLASVDLGAGILDRLGPSRLLARDRRRELLGRVRRGGLHAEFEQLILELGCRLDALQLA